MFCDEPCKLNVHLNQDLINVKCFPEKFLVVDKKLNLSLHLKVLGAGFPTSTTDTRQLTKQVIFVSVAKAMRLHLTYLSGNILYASVIIIQTTIGDELTNVMRFFLMFVLISQKPNSLVI